MNQPTDIQTLVAAFVTAATTPRELPAVVAFPADVVHSLRREAQARFNEVGLPRGLAKVAA